MSLELKELLYQALAEPIGLLVKTSDTRRARQLLYKCRAEVNDPALAVLQFRVSPWTEGDLVICKARVLAMAKPQITSQQLIAELGVGT